MFEIKDNYVQMLGTFEEDFSSLKITATRFSSILGHDKYTTAFCTWCKMMKLYKEDLTGNKYIEAGKILEPKIVDYLRKRKGYKDTLYQVKDVLGVDSKDIFKSNKIFGGQPDGVVIPQGREISFSNAVKVIEIKTASNLTNWIQGPPEKYIMQAALYTYLLGIDEFAIVCLDVSSVDLSNMSDVLKLTIDESHLIIYEYSLSRDFPEFTQEYEFCEKFWHECIETGKSPKFDPIRDYEAIEQLKQRLALENSKTPDSRLRELELLMYQRQKLDDATKDLDKRLKALKKEVRGLLASKQVDPVFGGISLELASRKVETVDKDALKRDGLEKYLKTQNQAVFTINRTNVVVTQQSVKGFMMKPEGEVDFIEINKVNGSILVDLESRFPDYVFDMMEYSGLIMVYVKYVAGLQSLDPILVLNEDQMLYGVVLWFGQNESGDLADITDDEISRLLSGIGDFGISDIADGTGSWDCASLDSSKAGSDDSTEVDSKIGSEADSREIQAGFDDNIKVDSGVGTEAELKPKRRPGRPRKSSKSNNLFDSNGSLNLTDLFK